MRLVRLVLICILVLAIIMLVSLYGEYKGAGTTEVAEKSSSKTYLKNKVIRVVDGDTVELESGVVVRYIGVNTPELSDSRKKVQCFAKEAKEYNEKLVLDKDVWLEKDVSETDKYRRSLRYVYLDDPQATSSAGMINEILVGEGYAGVMTIPPDVEYVERLMEAQKRAVEGKKGLWGACFAKFR